MEEFQDTLTRCAKLEIRKRAALQRETRLAAKHHYERKQLKLAQDSMYKVRTYVIHQNGEILRTWFLMNINSVLYLKLMSSYFVKNKNCLCYLTLRQFQQLCHCEHHYILIFVFLLIMIQHKQWIVNRPLLP